MMNMIYRTPSLMFLSLAVCIYAAFGSPTPDVLGWGEAVVGGLLVLAVGVKGCRAAVMFDARAPLWRVAGQVFFIYSLCAGLILAAIAGNAYGAILRDGVAFLFLMLPLFLIHDDAQSSDNQRYWSVGVVWFLGIMFAARCVFAPEFFGGAQALYYLANSPAVLFAAILSGGVGLGFLVYGRSFKYLMMSGAAILFCALCVAAMVSVQQRASLGAFVVAMGFIAVGHFWKRPKASIVVVIAGVVLLIVFRDMAFDLMGDVWRDLAEKTRLVGGNSRVDEWIAVWESVSRNTFHALLGLGWGASFASPAVAEIEVHYTHGLLSSLVLKTGVFGLLLGGAYVGALLLIFWRHVWRCWFNAPVFVPALALAVIMPFFIDVFLYASFKSLDFGLILWLMACSPILCRALFSGDGERF